MIPKLLQRNAGFAETFKELQSWRDEGLIPFRRADSIDALVAQVLRTVRERMT